MTSKPGHRMRPAPATLAALLALLALPFVHARDAEAFIYWTANDYSADDTNFADDRGLIGRANLDGAGVTNRFIDVGFEDSSYGTVGDLAVGADHIYWGENVAASVDGHRCCARAAPAAREPPTPTRQAISRANLDGTGVERSLISRRGGRHLASRAGRAAGASVGRGRS